MSTTFESRAAEGLEQLGLSVACAHLDSAAQRAAAEGWTYTHFLGYLLDGELTERHRKRVELNLQFAKFPVLKRLDQFEFTAQPGLDRRVIDELATGRFLSDGRNVILLGPPGVGKTHLAIGLGVRTAELGHRVYFTTAMDLAVKLTKAVDANRLHRELKALVQPTPRWTVCCTARRWSTSGATVTGFGARSGPVQSPRARRREVTCDPMNTSATGGGSISSDSKWVSSK